MEDNLIFIVLILSQILWVFSPSLIGRICAFVVLMTYSYLNVFSDKDFLLKFSSMLNQPNKNIIYCLLVVFAVIEISIAFLPTTAIRLVFWLIDKVVVSLIFN